MLQQVAPGIDAELVGRGLVAPFDAALLVEQHHAVGRGLDGGQELLQPVLGLARLLLALAQQLRMRSDSSPQTPGPRAGRPEASLRSTLSRRWARQASSNSHSTAPIQAPQPAKPQPKGRGHGPAEQRGA